MFGGILDKCLDETMNIYYDRLWMLGMVCNWKGKKVEG